MCELGEKIGEGDQLLRGLLLLCQVYFVRGEPVKGIDLAKRCLKLAETIQEPWLLTDAHNRYGLLALSAGYLHEAVSHLEQARVYSGRTERKVSAVGFLYTIAITGPEILALQLLGHADKALRLAEEALRHARESRHVFSLALMLGWSLGTFRRYRREPEMALLHAGEAVALAEANGIGDFLIWGTFHHGWALAELGQSEQGIAEMEAGIGGLRRFGDYQGQQYALALLAQNYAKIGHAGKSLGILNEALERIDRSGEMVCLAEMLRLKGEILLAQDGGAIGHAEACFREAIEVACRQDAKWWELRATTSLARLLAKEARRDEARTMLAAIYNWFTEGFDTADLKDAKELLEELNA
jgi:tetratricopeptide (TPR) repeat protein